MRKLRTIISAIVLTLASVFVSACSCGGDSGDGGLNINHIYAENISLKCLTNNDSIIAEVDPVSKDLYITCHVGDRFVIEYEITPSTATTTQVNWSFDSAGTGIVEPYKSEGYTRNKSTKEQVEFEAKARSDSKYKTTLTFTIQDLNKSANAYIEVYDAVAELASFVEPENVSFDNTKNALTWAPVTKVKEPDGDVVNAKMVSGYPAGLTGYEIVRLDPNTNEQIGDKIVVPKHVTEYAGLESGVDYSFKVRALADNLNYLAGSFTKPFKFYKLSTASDVTNEVHAKWGGAGNISFKAPLRSAKSVVYYFGVSGASGYTPYSVGTAVSNTDRVNYTARHIDFADGNKRNGYDIQIVSFPENYNETYGYAEIGSGDNLVRYYPSDATEPFVIKKLSSPIIELASDKGDVVIDSVTFADSNLSAYISLGVEEEYASSYEQGYYYQLFVDTLLQTPIREGFVSGGRVSLEGIASGSYVVKVATVGNANTINSSEESLGLNIIAHLTNDNITLKDDVIEHSTDYATGGIELFFVSTDLNHKQDYSVRAVIDAEDVTEFNIQKLGLHPGIYDVYAKSISCINDTTRNASTLPNEFTKLFTIETAPMVSSNKITKEGVILFTKLDKFDNYQVVINRKLKSDTEYAEEQVVNIHKPGSVGVLTYEFSETPYDTEGHNARISIESVVNSYLADVYPDLDIKGFFSSDYEFIYSIITVGDDIDDANVISSSATETFTIQRYASIPEIQLKDYRLEFEKVGTRRNQQYVVYLYTYESDGTLKNSYEFASFIGVDENEDGLIEVDINNIFIKGTRTTLVDLIDYNAINKVAVCALGSDGKVNSDAILNSVPTEQTFDITTTPHTLTMDTNGTLGWQTSLPVDDVASYQYSVFFYATTETAEGVEYSLLSDHTKHYISATFDEVEGTRVAILTADVGDVLALYKDQIIAITVRENKFDMISGPESAYLYTTRNSSPVLTRVHEEGTNKDKIVWVKANEGNIYDITVEKVETVAPEVGGEGEGEGATPFEYSISGSGSNEFSISDRFTDTPAWTAGIYTIYVSVRGSVITNNAEDANFKTIYVVSSLASSTEVRIVDASLDITVDGDMLSWSNICNGTDQEANYTIDYTLSSGVQNTVDNGSNTEYNASQFTAGVNEITVIPTIDFEESGFIIIGTPKLNTVEKWEVASGLVSEGGNLVLYVEGATDTATPVVELYQTISGVDSVVSTNLYYYGEPVEATNNGTTDGTYLKYTIVLDGMDAGELTFKVKVKSEGKLDSNLSASYTGTKIAAVEGFAKAGDWLTWESQPGISSYVIGYKKATAEETLYLTLKVEESGGIYIPYVTTENEDGEPVDSTNTLIFKYESGVFYYLFDEELFVGGVSGDIYFTIRPLTERAGYFSGNTSTPITITKLNANSAITVNNGVIVIANYEPDGSATPQRYEVNIYKFTTDAEDNIVVDANATYNQVGAYTTVDGGYNIAPIDLNTVGLMENGDYKVQLKFYGNSNDVLDSEIIVDVQFDKLETTALRTVDGVLSWDEVDGAENYTVWISDGTNEYEYVVTGDILKEEDLVPPAPEPEPEPEPTPDEGGEVVALSAGEAFSFRPGIWYTVKIKANASGKLHSKWSLPFAVKKLYAPTNIDTKASVGSFNIPVQEEVVDEETGDKEMVETTRTISVGTPIITWANKNSTDLKFDYYIEYSSDYSYDIPYNPYFTYTLATNLPISVYGIRMRMYGNTSAGSSSAGYLTSDYSDAYSLEYIDDVTTPTVSGGVVSWTAVNQAFAYDVTAYKQSEYAEYQAYLASPAGFAQAVLAPTPVFTTKTASTTINFAKIILADLVSASGSFTFVINALTRPDDIIVTSDGEKTNTVNIFKPSVFTDYKVKDGRLYWRLPIADVLDFVTSQKTAEGTKLAILVEGLDLTNTNKVAQAVLDYVLRKINMKVGDNTTLEEQIKHLISVRLDVNGVSFTDTPSEAHIYDDQDREITISSGYASGEYIEYYYDVKIEPEINDEGTEVEPELPDPEEPTPDGGEGDEEEPGSDPEGGEVTTSSLIRSNNTAGVEYVAGRYTIRVSGVGNSDIDAPVVNGCYTTAITAYKPNTPKTWTTDGADVYLGQVQWELSTTEKSTIDKFDYYQDYKITALGVTDASSIKTISISVNDTYDAVKGTNPNLTNDYLYYRNLKDENDNNGLFSIVSGAHNQILKDTFYRLLISTKGTVDSALLEDGDTIYLNSNDCVVQRPVNILSTSKQIAIQEGVLSWQTSHGSTATELYIYGPFDCWDELGTKINKNWVDDKTSDPILSYIDAVYTGEYDDLGLTYDQINSYKNKLHIVKLSEVEGIRPTSYTLTGEWDVNSLPIYAPGGYIIRTKELGDNMGVIDSEMSDTYDAIKLGNAIIRDNPDDPTSIMRATGWIGLTDSKIYKWNSYTETYYEKTYPEDAPNEKVGIFVWNPVAGANAYEVRLFYVAPNSEYGEWLYTERVRETCFDLPQGEQYNNEGMYFIRVVPMRTQRNSVDIMSDNFFSAEYTDSTSHERVPVPEGLTIFGNGDIQWNYGYNYNNIGSYRVQFNYGTDGLSTEIIAESGTDSEVPPTLRLGDKGQNGTVQISIKAIAVSGNGMLNSGYCPSVQVTRLADPDMRLINGVLHWGNTNGSDPITSTEFTTNGNKEIISTPEGQITYDTYIKYFTDITEHDADYRASNDEITYKPIEHSFSAMYQGTGGGEGTTMNGTDEFYISSNTIELRATKLNAPVISNVTLDIGANSENMVMWNLDSNALGYRVRVFATVEHPKGEPYYELNVSATELADLLSSGKTDHKNFLVVQEGDNVVVYFKLKPVIQEFELTSQGGEIFIYVQALGSGLTIDKDSVEDTSARPADNLYLASSYSTPTSIGVPPNPQGLEFNANTGVLSWRVDSATPYNIKVTSEYKVVDITESELAYWQATADVKFTDDDFGVEPDQYSAYPEIASRKVTITNKTIDENDSSNNRYTLYVVDIIVLTERDNGGKTPLSYQVTSTGIEYKLSVTAMSFVDGDPYFASDAVSLGGVAPTFETFDGGDGSENNPYRISNLAQLQTINDFNNRAFVMTDSINMIDDKGSQVYWRAIQEFNGILDGNNHSIDNFAVISTLAEDDITSIMSMFETNNGTIKNLNINVSDKKIYFTGITDGINAATLAIRNNGTIDNVHTSGEISLLPIGVSSYNVNTLAGGIVAINGQGATISNSSATMIVSALDDMDDYVSVGGIAAINYGIIDNTYFSGSVTGNRVAGIAAANMGRVDRCYVTEDSVINVTNQSSSTSKLKGATAGGVVATMTYNTSLGLEEVGITNSYSLATINVTKAGDASQVAYSVGGLVGTIAANSGISIENCYVVTNIKKVTIIGTNTINVYQMIGKTDDVEIANNYYVVGVCELEVSNSSLNEVGVCEKVDTVEQLKTKVATLQDGGVQVYVVTGTSYPTLYKPE